MIFKGTPTKDGRCWYFRKSKNGVQYNSKKYLTKEECLKAESKFILKKDKFGSVGFGTIFILRLQ